MEGRKAKKMGNMLSWRLHKESGSRKKMWSTGLISKRSGKMRSDYCICQHSCHWASPDRPSEVTELEAWHWGGGVVKERRRGEGEVRVEVRKQK